MTVNSGLILIPRTIIDLVGKINDLNIGYEILTHSSIKIHELWTKEKISYVKYYRPRYNM